MESQTEILNGQLIETQRAADAAQQSADTATLALHLTERADLAMDRINADHVGGQLVATTRVIVWFKNRGRTRPLKWRLTGEKELRVSASPRSAKQRIASLGASEGK